MSIIHDFLHVIVGHVTVDEAHSAVNGNRLFGAHAMPKDNGPDLQTEHLTLPATPDFWTYSAEVPLASVTPDASGVMVSWKDGTSAHFNTFMLRENSVTDGGVDPVTRERVFDISLVSESLAVQSASIDETGSLVVTFSPDGARLRYHPGWLLSVANRQWLPNTYVPAPISWNAADMREPVSFDGPTVLSDDAALSEWLVATQAYGLSRLRGLGSDAGVVEQVAGKVGVIRSSNFGFLFDVESKPDPDSTAYTSGALVGHTDLPTREVPPGFQVLHCRQNTCVDGHSTMADGFRITEDLKADDPDAYEALATIPWVFGNRHRGSDYRYTRPVLELMPDGRFSRVHMFTGVRMYPDADGKDVERAYRSLRIFMRLVADERYICRYPFAPGDLVIFDNNRVLHGRDSFDPSAGVRQLRGCYLDRDEILSRLRVLARDGYLQAAE